MRVEKRDRQPDTARRALTLAMILAPAAAIPGKAADEPSGEYLVRRFWDAFSQGSWSELDVLVLPIYRHHTPDSSITLDGFKNGGRWIYRGLAGYLLTIDALVSNADTVAVRWTAQGVHVASFYGEPVSGKLIVTRGMNFHRIEQGRIAEDWEVIDFDGFKRQLGANPHAK